MKAGTRWYPIEPPLLLPSPACVWVLYCPRTFVAVGEEKYPAPLAVEGREVVHNHPRILGDAATKHTHPFPVSSLQLGGRDFSL